MFRGYAGAAVPRLQKLLGWSREGNITGSQRLEEEDRAASARLYWMMLMICKGAALNIVFLAGDNGGLEAWRLLREKYEPKMRTRYAGQMMSILSFSLQENAAERITAWEREVATYKCDRGKILDDEIKIGTCLLRLPESQLKMHLLIRVDALKKSTDFRDEVVAISRAISAAQSQPTPIDIGAVGKGPPSKGGKGAKGCGKRNNQTQQACSRCGNTDHTPANFPHFDKACRKCGKVGHLASACRSAGTAGPPQSQRRQRVSVTKCWTCGETVHLSYQCSKKNVHAVQESGTVSPGSQETTMIGAIGSYFDLGSVREEINELRGAGEEICSDVSCLPANIGPDTCPLHGTWLSMCGGHHVAASGGKSYGLGARILGLEAGGVRGNMANLLVRFRVMNIGQALLSTQDLSRCGGETTAECSELGVASAASDEVECINIVREEEKP